MIVTGGYNIYPTEIDDILFSHPKILEASAAENQASMLQDVSSRRRTEIEAINGAIVEQAEELNISTPANRMLTALVKIIQSRYLS